MRLWRGDGTGQRTRLSRARRLAVDAVLIVLAAVASIAVALWVTPMQQITAAGQTVLVGVTAPSLSLSGPGELDLFGQRIATNVQFSGPVRPRLQLSRITLSRQLDQFVHSEGGAGAAKSLEHALVSGWWQYFTWQIAVVAIVSLILVGALAGWQRRPWRQTVVLLVSGLLLAEGVNLGGIMITAYSAPQTLSQVGSLEALVGAVPSLPAPRTSTAAHPGTDVAVIGDSTAAGLGNPLVPNPSAIDRACGRSADAYAQDLASVNDWKVSNLACSGATIESGLLGPQQIGSLNVPEQLSSPEVADASTIIVSVGANDVKWSAMLRLCAVSANCQDKAEQAYFQQQLATFSQDYLQLLTHLAVLPKHPNVIINLYYDPFTDADQCLTVVGLTPQKRQSLVSMLDALNKILADGARAASFATADPNFAGHGVCSDQPYVQGLTASAAFHPTAAGELAIALADEEALRATGSLH